MSKWYKINLKPLAPYFFGQELNAELGNKQSYYQKSAVFPQQSTLLGLIRHQILLQHGLAKPRVAGATGNPKDLVGSVGFKPETIIPDYGKIEKLSPVFFQLNGSGHYFLNSKDVVIDDGKEYKLMAGSEVEYNDINGRKANSIKLHYYNNSNLAVPYLLKFPFSEYLNDITGDKEIGLSQVVKNSRQVGVFKHVSRDFSESDTTEAYLKRDFKNLGILKDINNAVLETNGIDEKYSERPLNDRFELAEDWSFSFYIQLSDSTTLSTDSPRIVLMGKEQSVFQISITDNKDHIDTTWLDPIGTSGPISKIILLSDAYIPENQLLEKSLLVNGETVRFRSFSRDISALGNKEDKTNFARLSFSEKSDCYHLLKRGSVIFTKDALEIAKVLISQTNWRNIGYNYFILKTA